MLISRCTDPRHFEIVGIPPVDLILDVAAALSRAGLDAVEILKISCDITREFVYDPTVEDLRDRIKPRFVSTRMLPVKNKTLAEILEPQPKCAVQGSCYNMWP